MNQEASTEKIEPFLQFCILCDAVAADPNGKPVFVGIFDGFKKPTQVPQFFILLRWINGLGEHDVRLRILDPDLQEMISHPDQKIKFNNKVEPAQGIYRFVNFVFPRPGVYWIEISLNGKIYTSLPLPVYDNT